MDRDYRTSRGALAPGDRGRLQHGADGTIDMLNIAKRFQHLEIFPKISNPGHQ
jgi:hypothetical protein